MTGPDLAVVGGGIAGSAVALAARDAGADVLVLERDGEGGHATAASGGMLAAQYEASRPDARFRLCVRGRGRQEAFLTRVEELSGRRIARGFEGMLVSNRDEGEHLRALRTIAWQRAEGLRAEMLDVAGAAAVQPGVAEDVRSYLWLPDEGHVDSQALSEALVPALRTAGARWAGGAEATRLLSSGGRVTGLTLADGTRVETRRVVLAAGAWSGAVEGLPRPLPVRPFRGQMLRYPAGSARLDRPVADRRGRYLVPRGDGALLAGSTMEDVGFDPITTGEGIAAIRSAAASLLPALAGAEPEGDWAGLRPVTPDRLPVLGPDPELDGLHYATGYGRDGILIAPEAGRAVAEAALGASAAGAGEDWRPFGAGRFGNDGGSEGPGA